MVPLLMDSEEPISAFRGIPAYIGCQSAGWLQLSIKNRFLASRRDVQSTVVPSSRSSPRLRGANVDLGEFPSSSDPAEV